MSFGVDLPIVVRWWLTLLLIGWTTWPLSKLMFRSWNDSGYFWSKILGIIFLTWGVIALSFLNVGSLSYTSIFIVLILMFVVGWLAGKKNKRDIHRINYRNIIFIEIFFLLSLLLWSWVKAHAPDINGLEKFMDYGFTNSILRNANFPPQDMWFSGESINYYYFGHYYLAVLTKLSGIDLSYTFNLMLATLFSICLTGSFIIGTKLLDHMNRHWKMFGALFIAILVTFSGNLQTIYSFTKGYAGSEDNPPPFWKILNNPFEKEQFIQGWKNYWYPNATRFIPYTIHEFPSYSFVVSDIHGHVLSIPLSLLAIAFLIQIFSKDPKEKIESSTLIVYGALCGIMFMTNALDGPIYMSLMLLLLVVRLFPSSKNKLGDFVKQIITSSLKLLTATTIVVLPFVVHFKPFVSGIAVNCPPNFLAFHQSPENQDGFNKIGPFIFEGSEKCQKSPLWMMLLLWGFFLYGGLGIIKFGEKNNLEKSMVVWSCYSFLLIIFAEFFYFKDIYPQHFRSNTMFKLGYQAFIMMSIVTGYSIVKAVYKKVRWFVLLGIPMIALVMIYPYFSIRSYFGELKTYYGLNGINWIDRQRPDDAAAIRWLNLNIETGYQPVVLEANGDSYTDYERISTFTGLPTIAGWTVHEWLWRGGYGPIAERAEEVKQVYEKPQGYLASEIIKKYKVEYIVVGDLERQKYKTIDEEGIKLIAKSVFNHGRLTIYKVNSANL